MSSEFRGGLDRAAARGTGWLTRRHRSAVWRSALDRALAKSWLAPFTLLVVYVAGLLAVPFGAQHRGYDWLLPLVLTAAFVALEFGRAWYELGRKRFERAEGLVLLDERLGLASRLATADEFLDDPDPRDGLRAAFQRAAIEDASEHFTRAATDPVERDEAPFRLALRARTGLGAALLLSLLSIWLPPIGVRTVAPDAAPEEVGRAGSTLGAEAREDDPRAASTPPEEPAAPLATEVRDPALDAARGAEEGRPSELPDDAKDVDGKSAAGESSEASSAAGASEARGVPSDQGQSSKASDKRAPAKKKPAKKPVDAKDERADAKRPTEESGSTAGLGSASGSNKNPATTSWSSKDQATDTEDEAIENDEEVDDEESESDARGGIQPSLRDRKPAASRDLSIGFGNRPNPNARGRGGPSQPKKSRGTASLILGVPIPDHVKGQPNPGKTKITQERIEPKADPLVPAEADERLPRRLPTGRVSGTTLYPWMRDLVRDYFVELRANTIPAEG